MALIVPPAVPSLGDTNRYVVYSPTSSTAVFPVPFPVFGDGNDVEVYYNGNWLGGWTLSSASGNPMSTIPLPVTDAQVTLGSAISSGTLEIFGLWRPRQGILDTAPSLNRREYQEDLGQVVASLRELWANFISTFPLSKTGRKNSYLGFDSNGNPYSATTVIPGTITVSSAMAPVVAAATIPIANGLLGFSSYVQGLVGNTTQAAWLTAQGFSSFFQTLIGAANSAAFFAAAGMTSLGSSLTTAANAAAAMTALGFSSFFQSLVSSTNAAALLTTQGFSSFFQTLIGATTAGQLQNLLDYSPVRRQTVVAGPVNLGLPNLLPATSASLSVTSTNVTSLTPLVVTAANGGASGGANDLVGIATANLTWSGLTGSTTNYLYVVVAANGTLTTGSTTIAPAYQWGGTIAVTNKALTFDISQMAMFQGNGSSAVQAYIVLIGEAVAGASTITSTVTYAFNGVALSALTAFPAANAKATFAHNLGVPPLGYSMQLRLVCATTDHGYAVGMEIEDVATSAAGNLAAEDLHNASFSTDNTVAVALPPYGGGAATNITNANWNLRLTTVRNF